jgi:hypothetical protein
MDHSGMSLLPFLSTTVTTVREWLRSRCSMVGRLRRDGSDLGLGNQTAVLD